MELVQPNAALEIDMLIHDCRQYAELVKARLEFQELRLEDVALSAEPSEDPLMHVIRLRKLKDALIRLSGRDPLKWAT